MKDYLTSQKLSKKLKLAGYPQNSVYCWVEHEVEYMTNNRPNGKKETRWYLRDKWHESDITFAAPLSDELLEQLPKMHVYIKKMTHLSRISSKKNHTDFEAWYEVLTKDNMTMERAHTVYADKPADALAKLWLWCKKEGYIK